MSGAPRTTLRAVEPLPRRLDDYRGIAPDALLEEVRALAGGLDGARVLHLSATASGGAVAELLASEVGLLRGLGVEAEWRVIHPDEQFFRVMKRIHNAMQGQPVALDENDLRTYLERSRRCAAMLGDECDVIVVHDPQPALLVAGGSASSAAWVWRCHIDASTPDPAAWELMRAFLLGYDAFVVSLPEFSPPGLDRERLTVVAPAIDPLSAGNRPLPRHRAHRIVASRGIDLARPLVVAVCRFDPGNDPLDLVAAWRLAGARLPGLQLALVGAIAAIDYDSWAIHEQVRKATARDTDCHLLTNLSGIGPLEMNAFQRVADVVVHQSLREGFGRSVSEALWKGTPVVGGNTGGIPLEFGGHGGPAGGDAAGCAAAIVAVLEDAFLAQRLGHAGRDRVRQGFLTPRLVRDDLALVARLLASPVTHTHGPPAQWSPSGELADAARLPAQHTPGPYRLA